MCPSFKLGGISEETITILTFQVCELGIKLLHHSAFPPTVTGCLKDPQESRV